MGMSETVIAAIIGAIATVSTAIVQLFRNRPPSDSRPKKSRMRSVVATIALMIGCIVGGYAWSTLRAASAREELRAAMQAELNEFATRQAAQLEAARAAGAARSALAGHAGPGVAESFVNLPACRIETLPDEVGPVTCTEQTAHTVALCAAVPAASPVANVRVLARVPGSEEPWNERNAGTTTLGSLRMSSDTHEYPISPELRSVCLDVANYSVEDTLAVRLVVEYAAPPTAAAGITAAAPIPGL